MDYRVYAVTPTGLKTRDLCDKIEKVVAGGITALQYRAKGLEAMEMVEQVRAVQDITRVKNIPLIINDYVDVAKVTQADGVHLGQDDMPANKAREYLGNSYVIGLSVGNDHELQKLDVSVVDYVGCGAVFSTQTKTDAGQAIGVDGFERLRKKILIPVVGIGGITLDNAQSVFNVGADGVAMVSALFTENTTHDTIYETIQNIKKWHMQNNSV